MIRRGSRRPSGLGSALLSVICLHGALFCRPALAAESVKVEVEGLRGELRKNVLATLEIEEAKKDQDLDESRIRRLHAQAPQEIGEALQPYGYYRPVVQGSLNHEGATWVARYTVDQGPQLKVTARDVQVTGEGASDPGFRKLVSSFPLRQGEPLLELGYESGKKAFEDYAAEHGYLDAAFKVNQIRIDLAAYSSEIVVHYDTGPQFRFGPVSFHQDILRPELLTGYVNFKRGDTLAASTLLALQEALADSPYFSRVEVVPRRDLAQGVQGAQGAQGVEVPIDVNLVPAKRQKWTAGLGYGTDTGPRGTAGLEIRRINDRGHRADAEGKLSLIEKSFKSDYILPGAFPRTDLLTFTAGFADLRPKTSQSKTELVGAGLTEKAGRWRQGLSLHFQRETFTVGVDKGTSILIIPQASWSRVYADDRIYPSHGEKYELILRGAHKALLSNASFAQAHATTKFIQSLGNRRFRLISRFEAGFTETGDFRQLPPTSRFFAGGDQSVRGYGYQELGGLDEKGNVIGGKDLLAASVELEYRFLQKWGVATFYDAGNAGLSLGRDLRSGTGVGLRWLSPIGMVRVDVAWAISRPGHPIRLHLYLGPDL